MIEARHADERTKYKSKKGVIIEVKPKCSKCVMKKLAPKRKVDSVLYRCKSESLVYYGWLPADYELEIIKK